MVDNEFLKKLSQNLLKTLNDDEYSDITIEVEIFHIILRYIYGGKLSLEEYDTSDIVKILVAANELCLQELVTHLQSFLIKNKTDWMEKNFNLTYQTSFENNSFLELQEYCTNLISEYPDKILESLDFSTIPENLLISIIQSDNLQIDEVQIWEHVLKWGLAQNPGLSSDHSTYSKDDFISLKNTLQRCIPFIRFYNLTSKDFADKVLPYKKVLSKELYTDLLKTFLYLHPNSKPSEKSKPRMTKKYSQTNSENKQIKQSHIGSLISHDSRRNNVKKIIADISDEEYPMSHESRRNNVKKIIPDKSNKEFERL
ncbi:BTB/POZ protein [Rhizophagus clarus]|uniref:BTB/POZ protein n=1 Tax=Rhizophagus clarus TaxID=94130 RepID=A0A8H3M473_9GLOM|nr:BTB/POZ protein [Rhizophagus clarus]